MRKSPWIILVPLVILGAIALLFRDRIAQLNQEDLIRLSYLFLLLVLVGSGGLAFRDRLGTQVRNAAIWLLILFGAMGVYAFRDQFSAMLNPTAPRAVGEAIELRRAEDGHFWADVMINGVSTRMMVDTGASDIVLTQRDARRVGLDPASLRYTIPVSTAMGRTFAAPVTLNSIALGSIHFDDAPASITREETDTSLLGMTFMNALAGFEVRGDTLILRP